MLMMRALCGLLQPIQKLAKHCLALQGRLRTPRVLMMLAASWGRPLGPETHIAWGMAAKCLRVSKSLRAWSRGPVKKRGSDEADRQWRSRLLLKQS